MCIRDSAIGGKLVRNELSVDELVANDVGQNQDCVLRGLALRVREVGGDWDTVSRAHGYDILWRGWGVLTLADVLHLSLGSAFMLDTNGAAASAGVGCHLGCVCLGSRA